MTPGSVAQPAGDTGEGSAGLFPHLGIDVVGGHFSELLRDRRGELPVPRRLASCAPERLGRVAPDTREDGLREGLL